MRQLNLKKVSARLALTLAFVFLFLFRKVDFIDNEQQKSRKTYTREDKETK